VLDFQGNEPPEEFVVPHTVVELHDLSGVAARQALELYRVSFSSPAEPPDTQIEKLMHKGFYRTLVMYNEEGLVIACAFVVELTHSAVYHVDYFCVRPGMRGGGIGSKFFKSMVEFFKREAKYSYITLESETRMVPYYLKLNCADMHVQSDSFGDDKYYLLHFRLSESAQPIDGLDQVVIDLKGVLHLAAVYIALDDPSGDGISDACDLLSLMM